MSEEANQKRLDRIEEKIDKLSEAMVLIARTDEKIVAMEQKYSAQYDRMNRFSQKLDDIEKKVTENSQTLTNLGTFVWILVTAIVGAIVMQYYQG